MPGSEDRQRGRHGAEGDDAISERLIEDGDRSTEGITAAAQEAFEEDQRANPDHPTRIKRELASAHGVEDPAHSRGRSSGDPATERPTTGDQTNANRDRSDLHGSPTRPAQKTGETGSGRSASTAPSEGRDTRSKQSEA